jgi:flagellar motor switch protein FliM
LADYQAKIAANIMAGRLKTPTNLAQKISKEIKKLRSHFKDNTRHALEVDYKTFRQQLLNELKRVR